MRKKKRVRDKEVETVRERERDLRQRDSQRDLKQSEMKSRKRSIANYTQVNTLNYFIMSIYQSVRHIHIVTD